MNEQPTLTLLNNEKKTPEKVGSPVVRDQDFYNRGWKKFCNDSEFFRKNGKIRLIDDVESNINKGPKKRIAKILLDAFEKGHLPEDSEKELEKYVFSSKLALVGTYMDISEYIEKAFRQEFSDNDFADTIGFQDLEFPFLSHNQEYGVEDQESIQKFKQLFEKKFVKEMPEYNVFDIIQFRDRLKEYKLENEQKVGFPRSSGKQGGFLKRLKRLSDQNEKKVSEGDRDSIKYFRLSGLSLGKIPTIVKVNPEPKRIRSIRFEYDFSHKEEHFTLYLLLGKFADNRIFLHRLAGEFSLENTAFEEILEKMKESTKIRRAPSPSKKSPEKKSPIKEKKPETSNAPKPKEQGKMVIIKGKRGRKTNKNVKEIPSSVKRKSPSNVITKTKTPPKKRQK
jgi:hypothetical protein